MGSRILFSILIPAYKSRYLKEAIYSCLSQTVTDFEVIIVDDASPEDLYKIISEFDDKRIRYFRNKTNCGALNVVDNWNICLGYSKGRYVICMGDDDRLKPFCLEQYKHLIEKYPDKHIYHARTELINENGDVICQLPKRQESEGVMSMVWHHWQGEAQYIGDFCFNADTLKLDGGFFKLPLAWGADDVTTVRAASYGGLGNTQIVCFQYRENSQTISRGGHCDIKLESKLQEKKWFYNFFHNQNVQLLSKDEKLYYLSLTKEFEAHYYRQMLQYIKEYMQESLWNTIYVLRNSKHYSVRKLDILLMFARVVLFMAKNRLYGK